MKKNIKPNYSIQLTNGGKKYLPFLLTVMTSKKRLTASIFCFAVTSSLPFPDI